MKHNGKRWISLALVLCMVLTLLPVTAAAGDTEHTHCVCGKTDCTEHENAVTFNALTGDEMNRSQEIKAGTYYLAVSPPTVTPPSGVMSSSASTAIR